MWGPLLPFWTAVIIGVLGLTNPAAAQTWEPARFDEMIRAAAQARAQGNLQEAEQHCVEAIRHTDAAVIQALFDYAVLLRSLGKPEAAAAHARAERLRDVKTRPQAGSVYLGWDPAQEIQAFAALLREAGRAAEADVMTALAAAYRRTQQVQFVRAVEQSQGRDPTGVC